LLNYNIFCDEQVNISHLILQENLLAMIERVDHAGKTRWSYEMSDSHKMSCNDTTHLHLNILDDIPMNKNSVKYDFAHCMKYFKRY